MVKSGYTGISYPFRISPRGGVVTSTTSAENPQHIFESLQQIFGTNWLERVMEPDIYSDLAIMLFEPNDESLQSIIRSRIVDAVERLEDRVEIRDDGIEFEVTTDLDTGISYLYAKITFTITKYETEYTQLFNLGEVTAE